MTIIQRARTWRSSLRRRPMPFDMLQPHVEPNPEPSLPDAERVRALARHTQAESVVFQSAAVGALQMLFRVVQHEQRLRKTALSLAQQQKLGTLIDSLEGVALALRDGLSRQGAQMLDLCAPPAIENGSDDWQDALTETIHVLEESTEWVAAVVSGQPKGSAARTLCSIIARHLNRHRHALLVEAEDWLA